MSSELSEDAGELVREGKLALRPSAADKSRIAAALQAKLASEPAPEHSNETPEQAAVAAVRAPWAGKFAVLAGGVVVSLVAASVYLNRTQEAEVLPTNTVVNSTVEAATSEPASSEPVGSGQTAQGAAVQEPTTTPGARAASPESSVAVTNRSNSQKVAGDRLAEEAALLGQAEKAFHAGNFSRALTLTSEHRSKFPKGLLAQERVHLRVQALCGLGRFDDADKEQSRLKKLGDGRAVNACGRKP